MSDLNVKLKDGDNNLYPQTKKGDIIDLTIINNLTSTDTTNPLSANMGKNLKDSLSSIDSRTSLLTCLNNGGKSFRYFSCGCDTSGTTTITIDSTNKGYNDITGFIFTRNAITSISATASSAGEYNSVTLTNIVGTHPFSTATVTNGDIVLTLGAWQDFNLFYFVHSNQQPIFTVTH